MIKRDTSRRRFILISGAGALLMLPLVGRPLAQSQLPLVQSGQLVWDGAFRVPQGTIGSSSFGYSGWALGYDSTRNGLYMVGHDYQQQVAEISIPAASKSTSVSALPTATVLQTFADVTEGRMSQIGGYPRWLTGGLLVYGGRLVSTGWSYFDANNDATASHFTHSQTTTAAGTVTGPHVFAGLTPKGSGFVGGYMAAVPAVWQAALGGPALSGQCCIPIIGRTSWGPSAFVFNPADLGVTSPVPNKPLLNYPQGTGPVTNWTESYTKFFNLTTQMAGMFVPTGTRSLLFVGRHGIGKASYRSNEPDPYCGDGLLAPPYRMQVWAYNLDDLAAVKAGTKTASSLRPYAIWPLTDNLNPVLPHVRNCMQINGLAYDPATGRAWVSAYLADGDYPVIHQFHVDLTNTTPAIDCGFAVTPQSGVNVPGAGGTFTLSLTPTNPVCQWKTGGSGGGGLTFSPASGTGPATVTVTVPANTTGATRTMYAFAGSRSVDVTQPASGVPPPAPVPSVRIF